MSTTASRSGCEITVVVQIEFQNSTGRLNDQQFQNLIDGWEQSIEDLWNGPQGHQRYGCCTVRFDVVTRVGSGTDGYHQIDVVAGPQTSRAGLGPGSVGGQWDDQDNGNVAAHETGHLMGLDDEYDYGGADGAYRNLNPQPDGQPQSIMAQTWGNVAALQEHIDEIIGNLDVECPWWCCIFFPIRWLRDWIRSLIRRIFGMREERNERRREEQ